MVRLPKSVLTLIAAGAGAGAIAAAYIPEREGTSLSAYRDAADVWTICRGSTKSVQPGQVATPEECDARLSADLAEAFAIVDRLVTAPISEPRRAALASFCFNVGAGNCQRSTLIRRINAGDPDACDEMLRWTYVAGRDCRRAGSGCSGIVTRRQEEAALCRL